MSILLLLAFIPLTVFTFVAVLNAFTFPRLRKTEVPSPAPFVSVLVPMRNEAAVIAETVNSLLEQDYPNLEILILDDQSTDVSAQIVQRIIHTDPRLKLISGSTLPAGWLGKPWACHQLSQRARGSYLLFTDADVHWDANAVTSLVHETLQTRADLFTAWPTQKAATWGERLVIPLMAFAVLAYLPVIAVHHLPWPIFSAAVGQCLLFRREGYHRLGGHASIKNNIVDDMALAYAAKRHSLRLRTADANGLLQTRMYLNWDQVRDGFSKNILAGHGNRLTFLVVSTVFHWFAFLFPWFALLLAASSHNTSLLIDSILLIVLTILTRALTAAVSRQRILDSIFMPLSVLLMTRIALQALQWWRNGEVQWKGRRFHFENQ